VNPWWKGAVVYQIYPRSFADSNGDGVGDLPGITRHLDHVASLGVDAIWLSPFFTSPMKDFGYDVSDYLDVDPIFGTLADFDALLAGAHERGLKVIIDQVWSHTSDQHPWFIESASRAGVPPPAPSRREGEHFGNRDWYVWADPKPDGTPPNNWLSIFGGVAWQWHAARRQYYLHNFLVEQPDLNFHCGDVQEAILEVAKLWLDRGVDGFRLDVVNFYAHDALLRDNPPAPEAFGSREPYAYQKHVFDKSRPETLTFLARLRALMDTYPGERMTVGEIGDDDPLARQKEYTEGEDRLHTAYSFFLLNERKATPALFAAAQAAWADGRGWPSWSLGNHDVPRFPSRFAPGGTTDDRLTKVLLATLLCLRGTIFLYQGDELGLPQANVPLERLRDPLSIRLGHAYRDGARTPMPWSADAVNLEFSNAAETWLPPDLAHASRAAATEERDPDSVLHFTRRFLALRKIHPALRDGETIPAAAPEGVLAFARKHTSSRILCVFELAGKTARLDLPEWRGADVLPSGLTSSFDAGALTLPPYGGALLEILATARS